MSPTPFFSSLLGEFLEFAVVDPTLLAALEQGVGREVLEASQAVLDRLLQVLRRLGVVAMRAAERLVHHFVDDAQRLQARGRDAEAFRGLPRILRALPED